MMRGTTTSVLIVLLVISIDFNSRILSSSSVASNLKEVPINQVQYVKPQLDQITLESLNRGLVKFDTNSADASSTSSTIVGMPLDEQGTQSGNLEELYIGDWLYTLMAIVNSKVTESQQAFGILKAVNVKTAEQKIEKVVDGQELGLYRIQIINTRLVDFKDHQHNREVKLVMYEPKN